MPLLALWLAVSSPVPAESRQLLVSLAADWGSTSSRLSWHERAPGGPWRFVGGAAASVGRAGLGWGRGLHPDGLAGPSKREGDGRSPAGIFDIRGATGYDRESPAGARLPYRHATDTLRCVDDPVSPFYNQLVDEASEVRRWSSAEKMRRKDALYRFTLFVAHNDAPVLSGLGSCIFLHVRGEGGTATEGCTALAEDALRGLLRWLDPEGRPVLVQLPAAEFQRLRRPWRLPSQGEADER